MPPMGRARTSRSWRLDLAAALLLQSAGPSAVAMAEPAGDQAPAIVLFREGRTLLGEGKVAEACLKFEESQRLDPSGGTLLNLALCHEKLGQLARSWSEFNEASAWAERLGRLDRLKEAIAHARALEPRLSTLTIVVVPRNAQLEGLRVERDGRALGQGAWSTPLPVDGGEHEVRVTAPGRRPFTARVTIANEGDAKTVAVPVLEAQPIVLTPLDVPPPSPPAPAVSIASGARDPELRPIGWTLGGVGLAQLALAGYYGLQAFDLHDMSQEEAAGRAADRSTVLSITGLATTAAGIVLLVLASRS
jgi:tetratricopeptide (TPR) repeat protein